MRFTIRFALMAGLGHAATDAVVVFGPPDTAGLYADRRQRSGEVTGSGARWPSA